MRTQSQYMVMMVVFQVPRWFKIGEKQGNDKMSHVKIVAVVGES